MPPPARWRQASGTLRPMLATLADAPLVSPRLVYEPKYDGIRALIEITPASKGAVVHIWSRLGNEKTTQFPAVVEALRTAARGLRGAVTLDGEIVALMANGRPAGFQRLQGRIHLTSKADVARVEEGHPVAFIAFDLLSDGDEDLRGLPLTRRRERLEKRFATRTGPTFRLSEQATGDGRAMQARARAEGWEGLIVKEADAPYHSGRRTPAWRKLKMLQEQEFVIGGWTEPRQTRQHFGALLLGVYAEALGIGRSGDRAIGRSGIAGSRHQGIVHSMAGSRAASPDDPIARSPDGPIPASPDDPIVRSPDLIYVGHTGTGFSDAELERVWTLLKAREAKTSPFAGRIHTNEPAHWVRPELVAQVRFTEWTDDNKLRHPAYLGLREDTLPRAVIREKPARPGSAETPPPADAVIEQLRALQDARKDGVIDLGDGGRVSVTNLAKLFWPKLKLTKGDLLRYYATVAPLILPAVADRPLVMKRFPNGVDGPAFYQQRSRLERPPEGVRIEELPPEHEPISEPDARRLIGGSLITLLYMTQIAAISQDPWFSRVQSPADADYVALDLDPGDDTSFERVLDVARWIRDELASMKVPAVPKTSGASGIHIYIPLPPGTSYESGLIFCQIVATLVSTRHPKVATIERKVKARPRGTVYVDYLQNILGKTLATAYSARASDFAGVSTPLAWGELDEKLDPRDFTITSAPSRFARVGDLWARLRSTEPANLEAVLDKYARQSSD